MATPSCLQHLEKGKLLTGNNFPAFVETWNFMVNRLQNLKGDKDVNPNGHVTVDNSDPEHPVIRYVRGSSGTADTEGVSNTFSVVTSVEWDTSKYQIVVKGRPFTFEKGLLTEVGENEEEIGVIETTPWTGE